MSRPRAKADEAYVKKSISIPPDLWKRIEEHLESHAYMTLSGMMTSAVTMYLAPKSARR